MNSDAASSLARGRSSPAIKENIGMAAHNCFRVNRAHLRREWKGALWVKVAFGVGGGEGQDEVSGRSATGEMIMPPRTSTP